MEDIERYVGIDWGSVAHQVCVMGPDRKLLFERSVAHKGQALHDLANALLDGVDPARIAVAIETPRGAIVETLVERGIVVYAINPKQLDRFRDRHTVAGAKDDRRDAFVLADSLRTDRSAYRRVTVSPPQIIQLREFSRMHEDLIGERVALGNRLGDQLRRYFPQVLELDGIGDAPWLWELLEAAPCPAAAKRLTRAKVARILRENRIRRHTPESVREVLDAMPLGVADGVVEASSAHVASLVARLRLVRNQIKDCERNTKQILEALCEPSTQEKREHRDAEVLLSFPGIGPIVGATMLTEAEQALKERDYQRLRALSGVAPVTRATGKRSGKNASVSMRRACNVRLRNAIHYWIHTASSADPNIKARYAAHRARGQSHAHALRCVGDRMLGVLVAMLKAGRLYEAAREPAALISAAQ